MADASKHGSTMKGVENNKRSGKMYEEVLNQLLDELKQVYAETNKVTDEILEALNNIVQAPLLPALELVDSKSVSLVTSPSGRTLYQVIGSSGTPYTCFTTSYYCSCPAYRFSVLKKAEHCMCKHILSTKLSDAMGLTKNLNVTDKELASMIVQIE